MNSMEAHLKVHPFFMMDENFLLYRKRAMQLLKRMQQAGKSWDLYVFSFINAIRKYTMEELVSLGISSISMGLESPHSAYAKLEGADTIGLTRELRGHWVKLLGSTIVGLEDHTPDNIPDEIERSVSHAFRRDFGRNGPSLFRICRTTLWASRREEEQLARGKTYEPKVIIERRNWA